MDVNAMVERWAKVMTGLCTAHDKDEADRYEASIDDCLTPILSAPIKQVREFYPKLLARLKGDPSIPFLVWRSYEVWIDMVLKNCPDEAVKTLKIQLAQEITELVEQDVKDQIPEQLIRALMWRPEDALVKVKDAVVKNQAAGHSPRLRGRESCLFLEIGPDHNDPEVCIQI